MAKKKKVEKPEVKEEKKEKKFVSPGKLAGYDIAGIEDIDIKGKSYLEVSLSNRTKTIMSKSDLDNQIKKK